MDPRLQQAGRIDELYALIDENPYMLENIDAVPFVNTPLHVAAASGNIPFAMEMLNLKPSFSRKRRSCGRVPLLLPLNVSKMPKVEPLEGSGVSFGRIDATFATLLKQRKTFVFKDNLLLTLSVIVPLSLAMDPRLQQSAESGNINDFYALIDENPRILENIDTLPFVNTPFHIAAASGKIAFAVEMLNLKPSFARKLNTYGYSPLHLAVEKKQEDFVTWLLRLDPGLARVKGREGITLFHLLVLRGYVDLVVECLITSPECIQDVTVNGQNALHLAVMNDRFEALQVLTGWIQRMSQRNARSIEYAVLNQKDLTDNTALHLAAYKNDHQACFCFPSIFSFYISQIGDLCECSILCRW
ncbi:unnamed protein product [Arabis nemorensis]|uniref:Uncharacterized protein n=1 Tax=Arabis nemorensis TaxID=586526 RepID=A0A565APF4_9BRAS|nr:unnamed protein product [Arabis nemorensis]